MSAPLTLVTTTSIPTIQSARSRVRTSFRATRRSCLQGPSALPGALTAGERATVLQLLRRRGFLVVRLPARARALCLRVEQTYRTFFSGSIASKETFRTPQDGERVLSHPGYLTPAPGWNELFEVRRSQRDPSYRIPPECEACSVALFDELRSLAMAWLGEISAFLTGEARALPALAASDTGPATLRVIHYDSVPALAAQLAPLEGDQLQRARRRLRAGFPPHTDNSLLTLAPRASVAGLVVRDFSTGRWERVEAALAEDEAILFAGDALSFASRHFLPALMHQPDALQMAEAAPATRLSAPLFLYPDVEATLDSTQLRPELRAPDGAALPRPQPARLPVRHLNLNVNNCRAAWPWKASEYYEGLVLARDEDSFPSPGEDW